MRRVPDKRCYRALFISDVHLGTRSAQAEALLEFLKEVEADVIYLVGDIIDFWKDQSKAWTARDRSAIYGGFHLYVKGAGQT